MAANESSYTDKNPTNDHTNPAGIIQNIWAEERRGKMENENNQFLLNLATRLNSTPLCLVSGVQEPLKVLCTKLHLFKFANSG